MPNPEVRTIKNESVTLHGLVNGKPSVLIFYRGGWCPYCTEHLQELAAVEHKIVELGYQLIAISPDQPSVILQTPERESLAYTLISDSAMHAANAFGLSFQVAPDLVELYKNEYSIDLEAASGQTHHALPHPAVFVVDQEGQIVFAYTDENYRERLAAEDLLQTLSTVASQN